jgi:hypothetical protein
MKHMIVCTPNIEKQLTRFIGDQKLINDLLGYIDTRFEGFSVIQITSDTGNGSSYLLHAIGNELRKKGVKISLLHFTNEHNINELTNYHLNDIFNSSFVLMDNLHFVLENKAYNDTLAAFLKDLNVHNCKVIYACKQEDNLTKNHFVENSFSDATLNFHLEPIPATERKKWAIEKMSNKIITTIPDDFFTNNNSNRDFLNSLQPYIDNQMIDSGLNHKEIRILNDKLSALEVRMLQNRLANLELNPAKNSAIYEQEYEKAADIREQQHLLSTELAQIKLELDALSITPKPSNSAMRLFIYYSTLQHTFKAHETALLESIDFMKNKLEQLNESKKVLDIESNKEERLKVFQAIVDWTETLNRFIIK